MESDRKIELTSRRGSAFRTITKKSLSEPSAEISEKSTTHVKEDNRECGLVRNNAYLSTISYIGTGVALGGVVGSGLWILVGGSKLLLIATAGTGGVIGSCVETDNSHTPNTAAVKKKIIRRDSLRRKSSSRSPSVDSNCSSQDLSTLHSQNSTPTPALPASALKRCDSGRSDKSVSFRTSADKMSINNPS